MPPQQQSWRPRNPPLNQQFANQGQRQPRPPAFQPGTFAPQTDRFPAPQFSNPPRFSGPWRPQGSPRFSGAPRAAGTPRFLGRRRAMFVVSLVVTVDFMLRVDQLLVQLHPVLSLAVTTDPEAAMYVVSLGVIPNLPPRPSSAPPNSQFSGNGRRSPTSGNRASSPQFRPQSQ